MDQGNEAMPDIQIDSAACEICTPSMRIEPSNEEPEEEMQDATASRQPRRAARARKVTSITEDNFAMPAQRQRSRSTKGSRASSRGRAASGKRSTSKSRKSATRGTTRSRSKSASKRSVSRRGKRA